MFRNPSLNNRIPVINNMITNKSIKHNIVTKYETLQSQPQSLYDLIMMQYNNEEWQFIVIVVVLRTLHIHTRCTSARTTPLCSFARKLQMIHTEKKTVSVWSAERILLGRGSPPRSDSSQHLQWWEKYRQRINGGVERRWVRYWQKQISKRWIGLRTHMEYCGLMTAQREIFWIFFMTNSSIQYF